jgi:hypothetical protein
MAHTYVSTPKGVVLEVEYNGKVAPTADEVMNDYVKMNGGKNKPSDVRIKSIKVGYDPSASMGTKEGLLNNFQRGATLSLSRKLEDKANPGGSKAVDEWNKANPWKALGADIAGGMITMGLPGGILKQVGKIKQVANLASKIPAIQKVANIMGKHKAIKAAVEGGLYAGTRSNVDSRWTEPSRVGANTMGSAVAGMLVGGLTHGIGATAGRMLNKKSTKAVDLINKLGGQENFTNITKNNKRIIESADPLVGDILKNTKLTPEDKSIVIQKFQQNQGSLKSKAQDVVNLISPKKSHKEVSEFVKSLVDKRYEGVDPNTKFSLGPVSEVIGIGKPGKATITMKTVSLPDNQYLTSARKLAEKRMPATMGGKTGHSMSNEMSVGDVKGVKAQLFDMMTRNKNRDRNIEASDIARTMKELNEKAIEASPALAKADRTFSRGKNMQKNYQKGVEFKGFQAGEDTPQTTSFARGIADQLKAELENKGTPTKFNDIVPIAHEKALNRINPSKIKAAREAFDPVANEHSNLQTAISNMPEYSKPINLMGSDVARFINMPANAAARSAKKLSTAVENKYEFQPKELMNAMYRPSEDVYSQITAAANKKRKGKVLESVMDAFAKTGGRAVWGGKF